jgi:ubiquinone/menaquinone biosynthesis C-methylase UbiE
MGSRGVDVLSQTPEVDWTKDVDYARLVAEELEEYSNIEVTETLHEGGKHAIDAWGKYFQFLCQNVWKTSLYAEVVDYCNSLRNPRLLSLGCGYGGVELEIAKGLKTGYSMLGVDLNPGVFAQARKRAAAENIAIEFVAADLNYISIEENAFDLIMAHASLHHVLNLEHVFTQIQRGLKDGGRLAVQDVIGQSQVLFWRPNVEFALSLVAQMPHRYREGVSLPPYVAPARQIGMEGIRQEEIEPLLERFFEPIKVFRYGAFMRLIATDPILGRRFDEQRQEDREYLDYLYSLDVRQVSEGRLRPTELLGVYRRRDHVDLDSINAEARVKLEQLRTA